jgi:hypothetical protein
MDLRSFVLVQASLEDLAPVVAAVEELVRRPIAGSRPPAKATGHPLDSDRSTAFCTMTGTSHSAQLRCSPMGASTGDIHDPSNRPLSTNVMNAQSRSISKFPNISV